MDSQPSPHPTFETLRAYALGELDDTSATVVREHLETCSDCRRQVAEMAPDSFVGRLREAQERLESPSSNQAFATGTQTALPADDGVTVDSSSSPCMSATGGAEVTSDNLSSSNDARLQPGTLVGYFGDYELQKVLGEGGMGIVYKARQLSLNRPVALKMIKASRFPSADEVRRFQNEAEAVARLDHPNIVPIFEVGQYEDQHYFSMKLIAGESLDKRLKDYVADPRRAAATGGDDGRRDPPRPSARHPPPRPEAGEHPGRCRGAASRHRLRPGQAGRRGQRADPVRRDPGHAGLHGPRAGVGQARVRGTPYSIIDRGVKARQAEVRNVTLNY